MDALRGLLAHLALTLRLNFRSRQPLVYGYLVPVFFLLAFGSVFRSVPPLLPEMGQLLTITVLGGACFGMPTAMVAERERGVWRRYRLLPGGSGGLILSAMAARYALVLSAAAMQIGLAWCIYRTPLPARPGELLGAFTVACFAFLGLGLIVAMLADTVPAVQALGQAIFLPVIMIGGVGVPLRALPDWAQYLARFFPGVYAVEALQACVVPDGGGLSRAGGSLASLAVIGAAACLAGAKLFRWDAGPRPLGARAKTWVALALAAWAAVGLANVRGKIPARPAVQTKPEMPAAPALEPWQQLTAADLDRISFDGLTADDGYVVPFAADYSQLDGAGKQRVKGIRDSLAYWKPGREAPTLQRVHNLLSVCSVADLAQDENEAEIALAVYEQLKGGIPVGPLRQALGWIILHPEDGAALTDISELGATDRAEGVRVRERCVAYAKKFLLRLAGRKAPDAKAALLKGAKCRSSVTTKSASAATAQSTNLLSARPALDDSRPSPRSGLAGQLCVQAVTWAECSCNFMERRELWQGSSLLRRASARSIISPRSPRASPPPRGRGRCRGIRTCPV